uniref:Uncharacterized protein n=1 Tax=Tetranychus urticae TaxID=32264 RepID=T1KWE0_TETUR
MQNLTNSSNKVTAISGTSGQLYEPLRPNVCGYYTKSEVCGSNDRSEVVRRAGWKYRKGFGPCQVLSPQVT